MMDSELAGLMPNNMQQGLEDNSLSTAELRKYMKAHPVLTERSNIPPQFPQPLKKNYVDDLALRTGTGRMPQAKRFCIRIKRPQGASPLPAAIDSLDPEELKDAILQQAVAQRRALVMASLRPGSGRIVKRANIVIKIRPPVVAKPLVFEDASGPANTSHVAQLGDKTSPAGLLAHYPSPVEGVPERIVSQRRVTFSPIEGLGELHAMGPPPPRRGSDSPVEGLVHHASGNNGGPRLVDADGFAFPEPPRRTDMAIQTGTSLHHAVHGTTENTATDNNNIADYGGDGGGADYDDDFGGFDGGDFGGDWDDVDNNAGDGTHEWSMPALPPPRSMAPPRPRAPRRPVKNPGANLRKELPRKSLAVDPHVGRQEVAPGIRRSTRATQEPLRWWLGEKKDYDRISYKAMPTISQVTHTDPNTPWRTIPDPKDWKVKKKYGHKKLNGQQNNRKKAATKKQHKAATRRKDLDDEIEIRKEQESGDDSDDFEDNSDDDETELLPRSENRERDNRGGGVHKYTATPSSHQPKGQDATPTPVRAIDLTSPLEVIEQQQQQQDEIANEKENGIVAVGRSLLEGDDEIQIGARNGVFEEQEPTATVGGRRGSSPSPAPSGDQVSWGGIPEEEEEGEDSEETVPIARNGSAVKFVRPAARTTRQQRQS